jgi:hypothetical protein
MGEAGTAANVSNRVRVMPTSGRPWQKLNALAAAIEAAAQREPYPRLAQLMQAISVQQAGTRGASSLRA